MGQKEIDTSLRAAEQRRRDLKNMAENSGGMILADGSFWCGDDRRSGSVHEPERKKSETRSVKALLKGKQTPSPYFG